MTVSKLVRDLQSATLERQVEDAYNEALKAAFRGAKLEYPFGCDGYMEFEIGGVTHRLIIEYKHDMDLSSKIGRAKVLAQVVFYLKKFDCAGHILPEVVFVADKNECFVLHTNPLVKQLDFEGVDWSVAPSNAHSAAPDLVLALAEDDDCNAFVFDVNEGFDFAAVAEQIRNTASGTRRKVHITEHNVDTVFNYFKDKIGLEKKISPNDLVALFFAVITNSEDVYLCPTKKNCLVYKGTEMQVNSDKFKVFRQHFQTSCSPKEKARLAAISDRLLEDERRRREGAFFTPTVWATKAVSMISENWGENWRDEFVVVDPACGTLNLERDYRFRELYASTLEQSELDIANNYCSNSVKFAFDFLNGTDEELFAKAPGLKTAVEQKKKILFYFNPPYANNSVNKADATMVSKIMSRDGIKGNAIKDILMQFIYRVMDIKRKYGLTDCRIALFSKPVWLQGRGSKTFREKFLQEFKFETGIFFNAGYFNDVSADWGISFSLWTSGETVNKNDFTHDVVDLDQDGNVVKTGEKVIYNLDNLTPCSDWCKEPVARAKPVEAPNCSIALNIISDGKGCYGKSVEGSLGYFCNEGNNIHTLHQFVLFSCPSRHAHGINVTTANLDRCCAAFTARKLVELDWKNEKNEFIKPNEASPEYRQFVDDSLVYGLFEPASQQFSAKDVEYLGRKWNISNSFFFVHAKDMAEWSDEACLDETYNEAVVAQDTPVRKRLDAANLSAEAKAVLDRAVELVHKSMKFRGIFDTEHPEMNALRWDQGWYVVKAILREYLPNDLKEFRELYRKLADKMRPMVYSLGFLR